MPVEHITQSIFVLRGTRVILDRDLAEIYGVTTGRLNEAVKRNARRFPEDFMFRLTQEEVERAREEQRRCRDAPSGGAGALMRGSSVGY